MTALVIVVLMSFLALLTVAVLPLAETPQSR
jgi:hypothetical protein